VEQTFFFVKPEAVRRGLVGIVIQRFEARGLKLAKLAVKQLDPQVVEEHYAHLKDKSFFGELVETITDGPVVMGVLEGVDAVKVVRNIVGATNPLEAAPGTIRGDYGTVLPHNVVHASDAVETAEIEIRRFFG